MFNFRLVSVCAITAFAIQIICDEWPDSIQKCHQGDTVCMVNTCNKILHNEGNDINLLSIDPFTIPNIRFSPDPNRPVTIDLNITDIKIYGLRQFDIYKIKGFTDNINGLNDIYLKGSRLELNGKYVLNAKFIIPIRGNGATNITIIDPDIKLKFSGKSTLVKGQQYMQTDDMKVKLSVKRLIYQFDNLYNGDKVLGETTNKFLNEYWEDIYLEMKPGIVRTFKEQIQEAVNDVMSKLPFEEFFLK